MPDKSQPDDLANDLIELVGWILTARDGKLIPISDGSRMAADLLAGTDVINLPMLCDHYLGGSADFLTALVELTNPRPNTLQLPRFALYPLIRGVIESSGQTVWVLGPDDRRERFRRLLQLQKAELDYDGRYIDARTRPRDDDTREFRSQLDALRRETKQKRRLRWESLLDAAAVLGIGQAEFQHGVPGGYQSVIREAVDEQGLDGIWHGRKGTGIWMFISGLSHPSMSRGWAGSITKPGEVTPDGYVSFSSEANPIVVRDGIHLAVGLHMRAVLCGNASTPPPGDE